MKLTSLTQTRQSPALTDTEWQVLAVSMPDTFGEFDKGPHQFEWAVPYTWDGIKPKHTGSGEYAMQVTLPGGHWVEFLP